MEISGKVLTGLEDGVICCRDVREATKPVYSFTAHERGVSSMSFAPLVPGMLATCSEDKTVKVWDVDADVPLQVGAFFYERLIPLAFSDQVVGRGQSWLFLFFSFFSNISFHLGFSVVRKGVSGQSRTIVFIVSSSGGRIHPRHPSHAKQRPCRQQS